MAQDADIEKAIRTIQSYGYILSPENKNVLAGLKDPHKRTVFTRKSRLPLLKIIDKHDWEQALLQEMMSNPEFDAFFPFGQVKHDQIATLLHIKETSNSIEEVWNEGFPEPQKAELLKIKESFIKNYEQAVYIAQHLQGPSPLKERSLFDILSLSVPKIGTAVNLLALTLLATEPKYCPQFESPTSNMLIQPDRRLSEVPITQQNKKAICYNPDTQTVTYNGSSVFGPKVKRPRNMFMALAEGQKVHKNKIKKQIWKGQSPENWEKELHDTASDLRAAFNNAESALGDELLPDATDSFYGFNLQNIEIRKVTT